MNVLSLFDGISCGMVALERLGISVNKYCAYEIDKYAIKVSKKNYPQIEQCGDVTTADFTQHKGFDLLIGGSPCTYWSVAKNNRETTPDGIGGQLFMQYVRALSESGCKYFLYENNYSIHKNIKAFISTQLGVEPIMINSALLSGQQRKRCYWTNISGITQPIDKGILVQDILESGLSWQDKSYCIKACYHPVFYDTIQKHRNTMVAEPIAINTIDGKSTTFLAGYGHKGMASLIGDDYIRVTGVVEPVILQRPHGYNKGGIKRGKCPTLTANGSWQHNNYVLEPIRLGYYGKGGQGQRIYSISGKSVTLSANGGGQGAKTGLYKIDLPDGDYIIRKLTPIEAERLQTLPDNYTEGVSNTQRYKCIGNGWTVDVIAHILSFLPK